MPFSHKDYVKGLGGNMPDKPFFGYKSLTEMRAHMPAHWHKDIEAAAVMKDGYMRAESAGMVVAWEVEGNE